MSSSSLISDIRVNATHGVTRCDDARLGASGSSAQSGLPVELGGSEVLGALMHTAQQCEISSPVQGSGRGFQDARAAGRRVTELHGKQDSGYRPKSPGHKAVFLRAPAVLDAILQGGEAPARPEQNSRL